MLTIALYPIDIKQLASKPENEEIVIDAFLYINALVRPSKTSTCSKTEISNGSARLVGLNDVCGLSRTPCEDNGEWSAKVSSDYKNR